MAVPLIEALFFLLFLCVQKKLHILLIFSSSEERFVFWGNPIIHRSRRVLLCILCFCLNSFVHKRKKNSQLKIFISYEFRTERYNIWYCSYDRFYRPEIIKGLKAGLDNVLINKYVSSKGAQIIALKSCATKFVFQQSLPHKYPENLTVIHSLHWYNDSIFFLLTLCTNYGILS